MERANSEIHGRKARGSIQSRVHCRNPLSSQDCSLHRDLTLDLLDRGKAKEEAVEEDQRSERRQVPVGGGGGTASLEIGTASETDGRPVTSGPSDLDRAVKNGSDGRRAI